MHGDCFCFGIRLFVWLLFTVTFLPSRLNNDINECIVLRGILVVDMNRVFCQTSHKVQKRHPYHKTRINRVNVSCQNEVLPKLKPIMNQWWVRQFCEFKYKVFSGNFFVRKKRFLSRTRVASYYYNSFTSIPGDFLKTFSPSGTENSQILRRSCAQFMRLRCEN